MQAQLPGCEGSSSGCMASGLELGEAVARRRKRATLYNTLIPQVPSDTPNESTITYLRRQRVVQGGSSAAVRNSLDDVKSTGLTARKAGLTPRRLSLHLDASPIPLGDDMMEACHSQIASSCPDAH